MKYGVVDIGSNTIRLNLYLVTDRKNIVSLLNKKTVAGLATYVENGYMTKKGADKLVKILKGYIRICNYFEIDKVKMFATASLRNTKNSNDVIKYIQKEVGATIDLVSGEDEARFGYVGISEDYDIKNGYIIDIGGGSTEITLIENGEIKYATSLTEGSLSLLKKYSNQIFASEKEIKNMQKYVSGLIDEFKVPKSDKPIPIYGVGGTMRATGNIAMELYDLPSNKELSAENVKDLSKAIINQDILAYKTVLQVTPERVHTIMPGLIIIRSILKYTGADSILISDKGVREGFLINNIEEGYGRAEQIS